MHMADALISPAIGVGAWTITAGLLAYSSKKITHELDEKKVPMMGVLGAFIFAAQMINFTIPATGSSGHLGGAMILAVLLGPYAAFLTIASVLTVQAFIFADGGILALGCNILNMGFFPCFIAYPFIYKKIIGEENTRQRIITASFIASIIGLLLGAFFVVLETSFSGISELPFGTFLLLMLPVHLAIGIVEGVVTAAVVLFVWNARPEIVNSSTDSEPLKNFSIINVLAGLLVVALLTGGVFSWFASGNPDGLEWSMFKTSGQEELAVPAQSLYDKLGSLQEKTSVLPDYGFRQSGAEENGSIVNIGTSLSGIVGSLITLTLAFIIGIIFRRKKNPELKL